jgi:hypothetical protein
MSSDAEKDEQWSHPPFVPAYADCIARVASCWARLEYDISVSIWTLAELRPAFGACLTSQIFTLQSKLSSLVALAKLRRVDLKIISRLNRFSDNVRDGQDKRNRILHDLWLADQLNPGCMARLRITAEKNLKFTIKPVELSEIRADLERIVDLATEFHAIRKSIEAAMPSLPDIPLTELHPVTETR